MQGSLALHGGLLYVGRHEKTARVTVYDLDGHRRAEGIRFRDGRSGRSTVSGLGVDGDRQVWVADTPASRVRIFSLFGREKGGLGLATDEPIDEIAGQRGPDARGVIRDPVDVAVEGDSDGGRVVVACGGERRHAIQLFDLAGGFQASLRSRGRPDQVFSHVRGTSLQGRFLYVAEGGTGSVQVFRDGDFHFSFALPAVHGARPEPAAVTGLPDGRMIVACAGPASALLVVDPAGHVLRVLAEEGTEEGQVAQPNDVVAEVGVDDRSSRVAVIDRDGERIQVLSLEGRVFGAFAEGA